MCLNECFFLVFSGERDRGPRAFPPVQLRRLPRGVGGRRPGGDGRCHEQVGRLKSNLFARICSKKMWASQGGEAHLEAEVRLPLPALPGAQANPRRRSGVAPT